MIEYILLAIQDKGVKEAGDGQPNNVEGHNCDHVVTADRSQGDEPPAKKDASSCYQGTDMTLSRVDNQKNLYVDTSGKSLSNTVYEDSVKKKSADWARVLEAATQRRTEVLMPENLENMWTKGRNYKKKVQKNATKGLQVAKGSTPKPETSTSIERKVAQMPPRPHPDTRFSDRVDNAVSLSLVLRKEPSSEGGISTDELDASASFVTSGNKSRLKRSNSTSDLTVQPTTGVAFLSEGGGPVISEFYSADIRRHNEVLNLKSTSDMVLCNEGQVPKLRCRVGFLFLMKLVRQLHELFFA